MKTKIKELITRFENKTLELPTVLLLTPDDLAELREEAGIAPERVIASIYGLEIIVLND